MAAIKQGSFKEPSEEDLLSNAIDVALFKTKLARLEAHTLDEELARLDEETRRLITEMQKDLGLKAA